MAETAEIVGKVSSVQGQVFAKGPDGVVRPLNIGDPVYEGDVVESPAGGRVELAFNDGTTYFLRDKESVTLDGMVLGGWAVDAREAVLVPQRGGELDEIARAIAEGNSLDRLLEETAAGRSAALGAVDDGHSFVQLLRIVEAVDPLGYQFGSRSMGSLGPVIGGDAAGTEEREVERDAESVPLPTVDVTAAASITVNSITADDIINAAEAGGTVAVSGTVGGDAAAGDTVSFTINGTDYSGTVNPDGTTWSIDVAGADLAADTSFDATVSGSDAAGNPFTASTTSTHTVDVTAPSLVAQTFSYNENQSAGATVATVVATDNLAMGGFRFTATGTGLSADGYYNIDNSGIITLTAAGAASEVNDFEAGINSGVYGVEAYDISGNTQTANVTLNELDINDPPVAVDDSGAVDEDATLNVATLSGVLTNDTDQNAGDTHTVTAIRTGTEAGSGTGGTVGAALVGTYGSLTINADGSYTYVANNAAALPAGATVTDTFTYTVSDQLGAFDSAELVITITGTNDLPLIGGDVTGGVTEDAATPNLTVSGTLTISDVDTDEAAFVPGTGTYTGGGMQLGSLSIDSAGAWTYSVPNDDVQYLALGETKVETFTVAAADGTLQTISVTITGTQDAPTAENTTIPIPKNATYVLTIDSFGIDDPDVNDALTVTITSVPLQGTLWHFDGTSWMAVAANDLIPVEDIENRQLVYVPATNDTGNESFTFTVSDGTASTTGNTLTFSINTELSVSSPLPVDEGKAAVFAVELSDARLVDTVLSLTPGGEVTAADYNTPLQYRIQDPLTNAYSAWTDVAGNVTLAAGATRMEVKVKTVVNDDGLDGSGNPVVTESLTLTAQIVGGTNADMANLAATGTTVINDLPSLLLSGPSYIREGADAVFDLELSATKATSTDVTLSFEGVAVPGTDFLYSINGGEEWISTPTRTITILAGAVSIPSFEVWVRTLTETPNEVDELLRLVVTTIDAGIANSGQNISAATYIVDPISTTMTEDAAGGLDITPDAGYSYAALGQAAHGTVVDNLDGTLTYTPDTHYSGTDSFTITKTNEVGLTITSTVTVDVTAVADAPTVSISVSAEPVNDQVSLSNIIVNGDFSAALATGWVTGKTGSGTATIVSGALQLKTGSQNSHIAYAEQSIAGLNSGQSYTFSLTVGTAPTVGNGIVRWNGTAVAPTSYTGGVATFTVTAGATNTLRLQSLPTAGATINMDNVSLVTSTVLTYTYTVDANAILVDQDGSETLGSTIVISSSNLPSGAVLTLRDGTTVVTDGNSDPAVYSWTVNRDQASGLQLTVNQSAGTPFTLTATATSTEAAGGTAQGTATTDPIIMPASGSSTPNALPEIGNSDVILSNEANFVGTVTQTIDTQFGDGVNTFSWVSVADSLPDIYANGELVTYALTVSPDGLTGTVTGSTTAGSIFELVIQLNPGADADVTYTQFASLLGSEVVGTGENMVTGGGNGDDLLLTFDAGGTTFDALITGTNYLDGTPTTINTNNKYIGAANNLMNPGERIVMDFASGLTGNAVASMQISFFNFDSSSRTAPDELTITGTTVDGSTFSYYVTNASLDANGNYLITAPGGELIETLVFESGSQSSFKLGIETVSAVKYDVNFDLTLSYQLTDEDGDSATGTISVTLDGDNAIIGTAGDDVLLGGSASDSISGGAGNDVISGGAGDDWLTGGLGSDTFRWSLADKGTAGSPAVDTITDFDTATQASGGDVLDLRDLLQGETAGSLADYLHFEKVGSDTLVHIKSAGALGGEDQTVVLLGVDLYAAAGVGVGAPDQDIINDLVAKGKLITDL